MKKDEPEQPGVTDLVARLVDDFGQLLAQHVELARIEIAEEARSVSQVLGTLALFTPLLVVGYAMLCFGVAFALAPLLSTPGAVLLVGALNVVVGGVGLLRVRAALKRNHLAESTAAVRESAQFLAVETRTEVGGVH
jgi:uncharacterized membrane protein YqjE